MNFRTTESEFREKENCSGEDKEMTDLTFMSAYLYSDAVRMVKCAENSRTMEGRVTLREEEAFSHLALLLLAIAFEAFVNEEAQLAGLTEQQMKNEIRNQRRLRSSFPETLWKFVQLYELKASICPNFAVPPFRWLVVFYHRNKLVHYSMDPEPSLKRATGTVASGIRSYHYLELAREATKDWYEAVKEYFRCHGVEESPAGSYVGILTSYQRSYWDLLGKKTEARDSADVAIDDLMLEPHERVIKSRMSYRNRMTFEYWDKRRCFTVLIVGLPSQKVRYTANGIKYGRESVTLEVAAEKATFPEGSALQPIEPVTADDLISAFCELLPRIRLAFVPAAVNWWDQSAVKRLC